MKTFLFTLGLFVVSLVAFAGKLVLIPVKDTNDLETFFKNKDLKIHHYCDEFVIATSEIAHSNNAVILDEEAFADVSAYTIVFCEEHYKQEYLLSIAQCNQVLFSGNNFLIMKILSEDFLPAKNDGMIDIRNVEARLPKSIKYPVVTEPDPNVLYYLSQVSAERMMDNIQTLQNFGTRNCKHPNIFLARDGIKTQFDRLELEVSLHSFPFFDNDNIIAIQVGTEFPDEYIVCGAHYDSYAGSNIDVAPGADDNASGTIGIIETARILSQYDFKRSIIYCAFSAEESGLIGSGYYAEQCATEKINIVGYFNLDMIGYLWAGYENLIVFTYPQSAQELADFYHNICEVYFPTVPLADVVYGASGNSDHASFNTFGYHGISAQDGTGLSSIHPMNPYIHTPNDLINLSVNSSSQVTLLTKANLACIATLAMYEPQSITEYKSMVNIYPNPTDGQLRIETLDMRYELCEVEIFDVYGRKCEVSNLKSQVSNLKIDISKLQAGIYFMKIQTENQTITKKIIKI